MENKIYKNITYSELIVLNGSPNYVQLLNTIEWDFKRLEILNRDKFHCKRCNIKGHIFKNSGFYEKLYDNELSEYKSRRIDELLEFIKKDTSLINQLPSITQNLLEKDFSYKPIEEAHRIVLNVHHKYYIKNKLPWEYTEACLETVCVDCHLNIHSSEEIPVFTDETLSEKVNTKKCSRCMGMGYLDYYNYYMDGICFRCDGEKYIHLTSPVN